MTSPHKRTPINWPRTIGAIGIGFSLVLSAAAIWYLAVIEVPATDRLQSDVQRDDNTLSMLFRAASSSPAHAIR